MKPKRKKAAPKAEPARKQVDVCSERLKNEAGFLVLCDLDHGHHHPSHGYGGVELPVMSTEEHRALLVRSDW